MRALRRKRWPVGVVVPWKAVKRRAIVDALDMCGGDRHLAARLLGIGKTTIYRMERAYSYPSSLRQAVFFAKVDSGTSLLNDPLSSPSVSSDRNH